MRVKLPQLHAVAKCLLSDTGTQCCAVTQKLYTCDGDRAYEFHVLAKNSDVVTLKSSVARGTGYTLLAGGCLWLV
jgi:hypothetical protein